MHETPRTVPAVTVVYAHGITRKRKLRRANRLLQAVPQASLLENLRAVRAKISATSRKPSAARRARHCHVVPIEPFEFRIQVRSPGADGFGDLQRRAQHLVEFIQLRQPFEAAAASPIPDTSFRGEQA